MPLDIERLRRYALARSLFAPTTLKRAIDKLGFVQADPIRAPARAQDLTLRHRVRDYRAGDLERRYAAPGRRGGLLRQLRLPAAASHVADAPARRHRAVVGGEAAPGARPCSRSCARAAWCIRARSTRTSRTARATNWFGGTSSRDDPAARRHALPRPAARGAARKRHPRCTRRTSTPSPRSTPRRAATRIDALVDIVVHKYAPLPATSLSGLVARLRCGAPQWHGELRAAVARAKARLAHACVDGVDWYWPADETLPRRRVTDDDTVRLLAPFDPVVWDRRRFELFWGWAYRFEAYTPAPKRKLGYYALPLLWRDRGDRLGQPVSATKRRALTAQFGYVAGRAPRDAAFRRELDAEVARVQTFVAGEGGPPAPT